MQILDCSGTIEDSVVFPTEDYFADGRAEQGEGALLRPQNVNVLVNGKPRLSLNCVPRQIAEAVMGRLFLEGDIAHVMGAVMVNIGTAGRVAYAQISRAVLPQDGWAQIAEKLEKALAGDSEGYSTLQPREWNPDYLITLAQAFSESLEGVAALRGMHTCALAAADDILYSASDIVPESALEKAIGAAFIDGIEISECTLVTNAPLGVEAFARLVHANVSVVITLACPSERDIALARMCRITLADVPEPGHVRILHNAVN